jgi:hypothetical protein
LPLFLLLIFSSSCTKLNETTNLSDGDVYTEEESMARSITVSNPHPDCSWTDPNCSVCQLHDSNGLHVYFYCGEWPIFLQSDILLDVEMLDNSNAYSFFQTDLDPLIFNGTNYYSYTFNQGTPSGFDGTLRFITKPKSGLGQEVITTHSYNCY